MDLRPTEPPPELAMHPVSKDLPSHVSGKDFTETPVAWTPGALVEYYSTSHNSWIPTQVVGFDPRTSLYDLACKAQVAPHKIRNVQRAVRLDIRDKRSLVARGMSTDTNNSRDAHPHDRDASVWFPPGCSVEYESASAENCWISAVVLAYHSASGLYDLDIKAQVPRAKLRCPDQFPIGAVVEYRGESAGQNVGWAPAKVVAFDSVLGLYDLN